MNRKALRAAALAYVSLLLLAVTYMAVTLMIQVWRGALDVGAPRWLVVGVAFLASALVVGVGAVLPVACLYDILKGGRR